MARTFNDVTAPRRERLRQQLQDLKQELACMSRYTETGHINHNYNALQHEIWNVQDELQAANELYYRVHTSWHKSVYGY